MDKEAYKKISIECAVCKTKFDIWISTANYSEELEENIKNNFSHYCPACKALEEVGKRDK